jgi:hypothetical protein
LPSSEYYADPNAALQAHQNESMFNVIDKRCGWKIDMIMRKSREFSQEEFRRRRRVDLQEATFFVASAEDVVIAKLEWAKLARSRQIEDVAGILGLRRDSIDRSYPGKWIDRLGLRKQWDQSGGNRESSASI